MPRTSFRRPLALSAGVLGATVLLCGAAIPAQAHVDNVYTWVFTNDEISHVAKVSTTDAAWTIDSAAFARDWWIGGIERDATTTYSIVGEYLYLNSERVVPRDAGEIDAAADAGSLPVRIMSWTNDTSVGAYEGDDVTDEAVVYDERFSNGGTATLRDLWTLDIAPDGVLRTVARFSIVPDEDGPTEQVAFIAELDAATGVLTPTVDVTPLYVDLNITGLATDPTTGITYLLLANSFGMGYAAVDLETGALGEPMQLFTYPLLDSEYYWPGEIDIDDKGHAYFLNGRAELFVIEEELNPDAVIASVGAVDELFTEYAIATPVDPEPVDEGPVLAETGANSSVALGAGIAAVGLGALALVAARRRAIRH